MIGWWFAAAFARPPDAVLPARGEHLELFVLEGHGHGFGGTAVVVHEGASIVLEALSPAGPSLFTVEVGAGPTRVDALDPGLGAFLARLPFARDLSVLYLVDGTRKERLAGFTVRPTADGWRVRGEGGPARVRRVPGGLQLRDRLRGYTLTVTPMEGS